MAGEPEGLEGNHLLKALNRKIHAGIMRLSSTQRGGVIQELSWPDVVF
jgi:hypothetical protein